MNHICSDEGSLNVGLLGQGVTWFVMNIYESLENATNCVKITEQHQHRKFAYLEEIAF